MADLTAYSPIDPTAADTTLTVRDGPYGKPTTIARERWRLRGNDVLMVSGTDEHGTPITVEADKQGVTPRALVDHNNEIIVEDLRRLGLSYDLFTRTTTANHYAVTQDIFRRLHQRGYIIEKGQIRYAGGLSELWANEEVVRKYLVV